MAKFDSPVVPIGDARGDIRPSNKCDNLTCGWDFLLKHTEEIVKADGTKSVRTVTRGEIRMPVYKNGQLIRIVTRCDCCYQRELYNMRKAQHTGTPDVEDLHRLGLGIR